MNNTKLLGFIVTRSKRGQCKRPVWAGFTQQARDDHKQWILDNVSDAQYDGETTFKDVESDMVVKQENEVFELSDGRTLRVQSIDGFRVFGYIQHRTKAGKIKDKYLWHGYVNGQHIENERLNVIGKA